MADTDAHELERRQVRRSFEASAAAYDEAAVLQRHVADELMARLVELDVKPERVLDLGCGTGYLCRLVADAFPDAELVALDLAPAMARRAARAAPGRALVADAESLPLAPGSFDLVVSNMALQWCDPACVFDEVREALAPGGLWMFSTVGPDTLLELDSAWQQVDDGAHVHEFIDMHHLGDALLALGFVDPVMDVDRITLTYPDVGLLLRDLKTLGVVNARRSRSRGLLGRRRYRALVEAYETFRNDDGELPSTWEVVYGHAFAPAPGSVRVSFDPGGAVRP